MRDAKNPPPPPRPLSTRFFAVTSTNVGIIPQNFLTFSFNPFAEVVLSFRAIPRASHKLLNLNQDHLSKKQFFWSNPYKIEVMRTFLIELLKLPNFRHMTTSTISFQSRDKIFFHVMARNYDFIASISKYLSFMKAQNNHFCRHHQNCNHVY